MPATHNVFKINFLDNDPYNTLNSEKSFIFTRAKKFFKLARQH